MTPSDIDRTGRAYQLCVINILTDTKKSYLVCCKALVIPLQSSLGIFQGLEHQLFFLLWVHVRQEGKVTGSPGQSPQELCLIAAEYACAYLDIIHVRASNWEFPLLNVQHVRHVLVWCHLVAESCDSVLTCLCAAATADKASVSLRNCTGSQPAPSPPLNKCTTQFPRSLFANVA